MASSPPATAAPPSQATRSSTHPTAAPTGPTSPATPLTPTPRTPTPTYPLEPPDFIGSSPSTRTASAQPQTSHTPPLTATIVPTVSFRTGLVHRRGERRHRESNGRDKRPRISHNPAQGSTPRWGDHRGLFRSTQETDIRGRKHDTLVHRNSGRRLRERRQRDRSESI